jgi:hypothetical protein
MQVVRNIDAPDRYFHSLSAYRTWVRGMRLAVCGAVLAVVLVASAKLGAPKAAVVSMVVLMFGCAVPGVIVGFVGAVRLMVSEPHRMSRNQSAMLRMLAKDVVRGLPAAPSGDERARR